MTKTIWVMWRPGEERVYTMAVQPPEPWATTQKKDGYFIASFDVELPDPTVSAVVAGPLRMKVHIADQVAANQPYPAPPGTIST